MDKETEEMLNGGHQEVHIGEPKIDWNQWHRPIQESVRAFDVGTTVSLCKRLGITFSYDDDGMNQSDLRNWVEDVCEGLVSWFTTGNRYEATGVNTYREEDTGILVGEIQLHAPCDDDDDEMINPTIQIKLRKTTPTDVNPDPWWFDISFILASQMF